MPRVDRVPLARAGGLFAVRVRFPEHHVGAFLVVDTGAELMAIRPGLALELGLDPARASTWQRLAGVGESAPLPIVPVGRVEVGGSAVDGLSAFVYDFPPAIRADGLLGLSFLSRFRATFEFDTQTLVLRSRL